MGIAEKIDSIIDHRKGRGEYEGKGHLQEVLKKIEFFKKIKQVLEDYDAFRNKVFAQIQNQSGDYYNMSVEDPTFEQKLEASSPANSIEKVEKALKQLEELRIRFERETINISVIGKAGQGKSRLLQSISGVDNAVIPADSGGDCTGAKSVICNAPGPLHAIIHCYTENELLEQVQKYLDELDYGRKLGSVSQIPYIDIESIRCKELTNKQESYCGRVEAYVQHFADYSAIIGQNLPVNRQEDIRQYVAQFLLDGTNVYLFLAVKEVQIFTEFNYAEAGKIMLVDTIGLGDTSIGLQEKMLDTLVNDSDAAIILRRPDNVRDHIGNEDNAFLDMLNRQMKGRDPEKWLFYVLNVYADNKKTGEGLFEKLKNRQNSSSALKVAFIEKIDCADAKEVEEKLIVPMLDNLAANLADVDNSLINIANALFVECYNEFFDLSGKIKSLADSNFKKDLNTGGLFDELYDELPLPRKLEELNTLYKDHTRKCIEIEDDVKKSIKDISGACPTSKEILSALNGGDKDAHPSIVYHHKCDHYRAAISDKFDEINRSTIVSLQEGVKNDIIEILRSADGGMLNAVPLQTDSDTPDNIEWMEAFIDQKLSDFPIVKEAFENILNYRLNIEGLLEYYVNTSLECMDPEEERKFAQIDFSKATTREDKAKLIEQSLLSAAQLVSNTLVDMIQGLLVIPYNSFYARIRKLREHIIYSKEGNQELKNLYREFATYIWKDQFAAVATKKVAMQELDAIIESFAANRSKPLFTIKFEK